MTQVFYHYADLEEHKAGMWRIVGVEARAGFIEAAATLMRDPERFRVAMIRAADEWPRSTEAAMTTPSLNQRAWFGHAGCCIETGSPEDLTRLAWHTLSESEQDAANAAADEAIEHWLETSLVAFRLVDGRLF